MKRLFLTGLLLLASTAWAGPIDDAAAANTRGDYALEASRLITLSCIVESGRLAGVEFQYQINETAKTIWASRQDAPTEINIGATEIRFKQGNADISISRITGRYLNSILNPLATGTCQIVAQRKF